MTWSPCPDPVLGDRTSTDAIEMLLVPRAVDLGEMTVRRALPSTRRQMVGPFIFFDQMGPEREPTSSDRRLDDMVARCEAVLMDLAQGLRT